MSAVGDRRPGLRQHTLPGLEHGRERHWSRVPPRVNDPLHAADACSDCDGTAVNLAAPEPEGACSSCDGTGWMP